MNRRHACAAIALATAALTTASIAPAGAHPTKKSPSRPLVGKWGMASGPYTDYATGTFKVTKHGKRVGHIEFTPNDGVLYCTPGHYKVTGSFAIHKDAPKPYSYHVGTKLKGMKVWQLNKVAYTINGKKQPAPTNLEIDFANKHAHVEFGPYGTTTCNMFWEQAPQ